jgi:16S rRNA C967 or C1407 C5-methylase (RsmB/RsmF family)/NOL1/NOP2/fmu family ribosome biogenesis protein
LILPTPLLSSLHAIPGFDEPAFVHAHDQSAITSIRRHPLKVSDSFSGNLVVPWCPDGRYLPSRPSFTLDPAFHAGAYYVQEASSMFLDLLLRHIYEKPCGLRILDLCAAPGGKSTLIASWMDDQSLLVSNEVIRSRASVLEENTTRWGYMNTMVTSNDPADFARLPGFFDLIVVDAPCSGSGLFRKDKRALDEWSEANVLLCSQRQKRILADVMPALKENGILIYATCSYAPQEDEQILDWLSATFRLDSLTIDAAPEWGIVPTASHLQRAGYRFFPDKLQGEGFFIAAMQKKEATPVFRYPKFKTAHQQKIATQSQHLLQRKDLCTLPVGDQFIALPESMEADYNALKNALYVRQAGIALGAPSAKEWLPAHDVALSVDVVEGVARVDVDTQQALKFLKKDDIGIPLTEKGWYLVSYKGLGLGWVKSLGTRANNYLPKHWRIRMDIQDD